MGRVTVDRADVVGLVTLDSQENRNALSTDLLVELADALESLDADPAVRPIVLTGGPTLFASGADVRQLREISPVEYAASPRAVSWRRIGAVETVMVAAVAGYALGGGCELALACDLVVAADTAVLGSRRCGWGSFPGRAAPSGGRGPPGATPPPTWSDRTEHFRVRGTLAGVGE